MEKRILVVNALAENFYNVVPHEYKTYCSFTARIIQTTLRHFGVETELLPCQVWIVTPEQNYIVGFLGKKPTPGKWDGHVICSGDGFIVDAALRHFNVEFGLTVPSIVATEKFLVPTQVISRQDLDEKHRLWWHPAPIVEGIDVTVPEQPPELISRYSSELVAHLASIGVEVVRAQVANQSPVNA